MNPVRLLALWSIVLPSVLLAQDPPAVSKSDEARTVEQALPGLVKLWDDAEAARKALEAHQAVLTEARAKLATEVPPSAPPFAEFRSREPAELAAELAKATARQQAFATRRDARATLTTALGRTRDLAGTRADSLKALANALKEIEPALTAVQRQLETGALAPEALKLPEGQTLAIWIERAQAVSRDAATQLETLAALPEASTRELQTVAETAAAPEVVAQARREANLYQAFSSSLQSAAASREELAKNDPATLAPAIERLGQQRSEEQRTLQQALEEAAEPSDALQAIDQQLEAGQAPALDAFPEGEGHAELREARRRLEHARATQAFLAQRLSRTQEALAQVAALIAAIDDELKAREAVQKTSVRLYAGLGLAAEWKAESKIENVPTIEGVDRDVLWLQFQELVSAQEERRTQKATLEARRDQTGPEKLDNLQKSLREQQDEVNRLAGVVEEEQSYAEVVRTMSELDARALAQLLGPEGELARELAEFPKQVAEARAALEAKEKELLRQRDVVQKIENPYTKAALMRAKEENRLARIGERLEKLDQLVFPVNADLLDLVEGRKVPELREEAPAIKENGAEASEADYTKTLRRELQRKQAQARDLVQYFKELDEGVQRLRALNQEREAVYAAYSEVMSRWILAEKRRYACARELRRRLASGPAPGVTPPAELETWAQRDAVRNLQTRRAQVLARQSQPATRTEQELERFERILAWNPWAERRSSRSDQRVILIGQPEVHLIAAEKSFEELSDVVEKTLRYEAQDRKAADLGTLNGFLVSFTGTGERARFDEPLDAYYLEREYVRYRAGEYGQASAAYEELIQASERLREDLEKGLDELRDGVQERKTDYHVARYLLSIAKAPEKRQQIEGAYLEEFGKELPFPPDDKGWDLEYWKNYLATAEARLRGRDDWVREMTYQLSKYGIEADIGHYRSHMARIASQVDVQEGIDDTLTKRIDELRSEFAQTIRRNSIRTAAEILIIPFVALLLVRLLRRLFQRLERRHMARLQESDPDRQRRLKTLTDASSAATKVLVWTLAIIYLLGRLGLDVTPIVASASVLGLAVAFGAQALIKDYFCGFFILLENQYTLGDIVDLGGCSGTVERISLRVTVLRDVQGTVHYVPNGTISRVSNKTQGWSQVVLEVSVSYGSDIDLVTRVLEEELGHLHAEDAMGLTFIDKPQVLGVEKLGESSVDLRVVAKVRPGKQWMTAREIRRRVKRRFDREGIEIPFPQRVIHTLHAEEAASTKAKSEAAEAAPSR